MSDIPRAVIPFVLDRVAAEAALSRGARLMNKLGFQPAKDPVGEEFALERYVGMFKERAA